MSLHLSMFRLVFLWFCLFHYVRAGQNDFLPHFSWVHQLNTPEMVINFTTGPGNGMARERVTLWNKTATEEIPVMGVNPSTLDPYPLVDCLDLIKANRKKHGIQLVFLDWATYQTAKYYLQSYPVDWIWVHFDIFREPNGTQPMVDPGALEKAAKTIPRRQKISVGWITAIGVEIYSDQMLFRMNRFLHTSKNLLKRDVVLVLVADILTYHMEAEKILPSFNSVVQKYLFFVPPERAAALQVEILKEIIEAVGTTISYLDATEEIKERMNLTTIEPPRPQKRRRPRNSPV